MIKKHTWQIPGVKFVKFDFSNNTSRKWNFGCFFTEIVHDEFLIGGMKSKARRELNLLFELIFFHAFGPRR